MPNAPGGSETKNARGRQQGKNRALRLLVLDVVDDLGHVVFVLAEFGGVFNDLLVLFLGFGERRYRGFLFLLVLDRLGLLRFEIGIDVLCTDRFEFALDRRRGSAAA